MALISQSQVRSCHGYWAGQGVPVYLHIMLHPYHLLNLHFLELCHCHVLKTIFTCKLQDQTQHAPFCMQLTFLHFHLMHFGTLYFPNYLIYVGNLKFGNHMLHSEEPLFKKNCWIGCFLGDFNDGVDNFCKGSFPLSHILGHLAKLQQSSSRLQAAMLESTQSLHSAQPSKPFHRWVINDVLNLCHPRCSCFHFCYHTLFETFILKYRAYVRLTLMIWAYGVSMKLHGILGHFFPYILHILVTSSNHQHHRFFSIGCEWQCFKCSWNWFLHWEDQGMSFIVDDENFLFVKNIMLKVL